MPAIAAPPAPSKPASAPAAPPATPPPSKPTTQSAALAPAPEPREPAGYMDDIESGLNDLDNAGQPDGAPKRDASGRFIKPGEKPDAPEPVVDPKLEPDPKVEPDKAPEEPKPGTMRALGKAYDQLKKERDEVFQPKLQSLTAKVSEYEKELTQLRTQKPDLKPIQDQLAAIQKENAELREVVRFTDYRKSPEFADKYEKPYTEAWNKAVHEVTQLTMESEDGTVRKATPNDLLALANAPLDQLDDLANKWFPRSSARVIRHVEKIRDLADAQDKALEEAKKGATEFQSKQAEQAQKQNGAFTQAYAGANEELTKKYPKWFAPDDTDPDGNEILKKGFDYADTVFSPTGANLTPEQRAGRLAVVRAKAANHDRLAARIKARDNRIAELEKDLAEYEKSGPSTDGAHSPELVKTGNWQDDVEAELRKMDR